MIGNVLHRPPCRGLHHSPHRATGVALPDCRTGKKKRPQCGCEACGTVSEGSAPLQSTSYSGTVVLELLLGTWYALPVSRACLACVHGPELALLANDLSAAIEGAAEIFYKSRYM